MQKSEKSVKSNPEKAALQTDGQTGRRTESAEFTELSNRVGGPINN